MISQYSTIHSNFHTLRNLAQITPTGAFLQVFAELDQTWGYKVLPVRKVFSNLESYYNPWIAHCQVIRYVVVWRVKGDRTLICDRVIGLEFEASFQGYVLLLPYI